MKERPILFSGSMVRAIQEGRKIQTRRVIKFPRHAIRGGRGLDWIKSVHEDGAGNWVAWSSDRPGLPEFTKHAYPNGEGFPCPYGVPGDRLWVREAWRVAALPEDDMPAIQYRADNAIELVDPLDSVYGWDMRYEQWYERMNDQLVEDCEQAGLTPDGDGFYYWEWEAPTRWRPSIYMPRWASRTTLENTNVRVERVQDIDTMNCLLEGVTLPPDLEEIWSTCPNEFTSGMFDSEVVPIFRELWDSINAKRGAGWDVNPWVWVVEFKRVE